MQQFADAFDKLLGAIAQRRRILLEGDRARPGDRAGLAGDEDRLRSGNGSLAQGGAHPAALGRRQSRCGPGPDEDKWVGWLHIVERELADIDRLHGFAEAMKQRGFTDVVLLGMGGSSLGPEVLGETFGQAARLAALPHAGQHRSGADQDHRTGGRSRQDAVHRLLQIRQHARAQHLHGLFPRPRRRGARRGQGRRTLRRGDRSRLLAGAARQAAGLRPYLPWRALDRRPLFRVVEVRPGAGGGDGSRRQTLPRDGAADGTRLRRRRAAGGESGRPARRRHGRRGNALRPRQGDDHRLAGDRRSRRLAGTAAGREHRQARARADSAGRRAAHLAGALRQRPVLCLSGAGRAARSVAAPSGGGAGAGRPSGRADQREGYLAHRPGILPLGDRDRGGRARSSASTRSTSPMSRRARTRRAR